MNDYHSLTGVARAMALPTNALIQVLTHRGLIESENRPSFYALVTTVAKKIPYGNGKGGHRYDWSIQRVSALTKSETRYEC